MSPLVPYPAKPIKGETNGYDKLEAYDEVVQNNIQTVFDASNANVDLVDQKFEDANSYTDQKFTEANTHANQKLDDGDFARLNVLGWARTIYIAHDAVVPTVPPYTNIIRLPAA